MRCICKEYYWSDFFVGIIYNYREEFSMGGFEHVFLVNNYKHNHAFDPDQFNRYFITVKELRKLKLERINERQGNL